MRGGRATQLIPLPARPADLHPLQPTAKRRQPAPLLLFTLLAHAPAEIADAVGEARGGEGEGGGALARPRFPGRGAGCTTAPGIRAGVTCLGCEVRPNRKNDHFCW
jgi:hypothetical protein